MFPRLYKLLVYLEDSGTERFGKLGLDQVGGAPLLQDFVGSGVQREACLGRGVVPPCFTNQGSSSPTHENLWGDLGDPQGTV